MGAVINLFPPRDDFSNELRQAKNVYPEELYVALEGILSCKPTDILRTAVCDGEVIGVMKLWGYSNKRRSGVMHVLTLPTPKLASLATLSLNIARAEVKTSVEQFLRLCFNTHSRLDKIYWNVHPKDEWVHEMCRNFTFKELGASSSFVDSNGVRYHSFFLERLK
ncbi:MAG: hypothetical protein Q8Q49_04375 [bacterium]|nr:hypothetical protein [bacterium]